MSLYIDQKHAVLNKSFNPLFTNTTLSYRKTNSEHQVKQKSHQTDDRMIKKLQRWEEDKLRKNPSN